MCCFTFQIWSDIFSLCCSTAERNGWFGPQKGNYRSGRMLLVHSSAFQPQTNGCLCFALPPISSHRCDNWLCSQQQHAWHNLVLGLTLSTWSFKGNYLPRKIVKLGSGQCWSAWSVSKDHSKIESLSQSSVVSMRSLVSLLRRTCYHFLN